MSSVQVGHATIEFHAVGSGDPVVVLPAGGFDVGYLGELAERLARGGFRAIRVNPRGAGNSRGSLERLTLHTFAADVAGLIEALATGRAHVVGHGFSNRIARCLAADRPDLVRSVILLGGIGDIRRDPEVVATMRMWFRADASDAECLEVMRWEVADPATAAAVLQRVTRWPASAVALVAADHATPREAWASFKGDVPVLVVQGLGDRLAPHVDEAALRDEFGSDVRLVNVPGAGHMLVVEQPASVADAVLAFLRSQSPRSPSYLGACR